MMGGFSMGFMWIILAVILAVVIALAKSQQYQKKAEVEGVPPAESALDVLKIRYARGEINRQEFEEKNKFSCVD